MTLVMILFLIFWLVCSILAYGFCFSFYQNKYPIAAKNDYMEDVFYALLLSLFGPVAIITVILMKQYKYGLKFR